MRRLILSLSLFLLLGASMSCSSEPPAPRREASLDALFQQLRSARSQEEAEMVAVTIRHVWSRSGRHGVDTLMNQAVGAIHSGDYDTAVTTLDGVVERAPDYVEGWNLRATVHYLREEYGAAVADIERVLALEPRHFGALAGLGRIFLALDDKKAALAAFEMALSIHPRLTEVRAEVDSLREELAGIPI